MESKVVIVTGACGALGSAVVQAFIDAGCSVAQVDQSDKPPALSESNTTGVLTIASIDLSNQTQTQSAITVALAHFGRVDCLINVAGGFAWETLADGSLDTWDRLYAMNLRTAVCCSQAVLPALVACGRGSIVNIGAGAALKAGMGMGAYAASKAGVAKLTEALAEELKDRNVTVNAILPSVIDTPKNRQDMPAADFTRWVTPQAIAQLAVFLASDRARAITGSSIPITNRC